MVYGLPSILAVIYLGAVDEENKSVRTRDTRIPHCDNKVRHTSVRVGMLFATAMVGHSPRDMPLRNHKIPCPLH